MPHKYPASWLPIVRVTLSQPAHIKCIHAGAHHLKMQSVRSKKRAHAFWIGERDREASQTNNYIWMSEYVHRCTDFAHSLWAPRCAVCERHDRVTQIDTLLRSRESICGPTLDAQAEIKHTHTTLYDDYLFLLFSN